MRKLPVIFISENGVIHTLPLLIIVAAVGVISFLLISSTAPFKGGLFGILNPRPVSHAATTVNGVPLCDGQNGRPAHNLTVWHPLVEKNPDGSVLCTYGHAHGAQPDTAEMNAIFGPLPQGQSISYGWATPNENLDSGSFSNKHRSYKWLTKNSSCPAGATDYETTALRVLTHMDGSMGVTSRFHSFFIQAMMTNCATGESGQFYGGGWIDQAFLMAGDTRVQLPNDPPAGCILNGDLRQEDGLGQFANPLSGDVWYGASSRSDNGATPVCDNNPGQVEHWSFQMNQGIDQFGPVDPNSPADVHMYDPRYYRDGHTQEHIGSDGLSILTPEMWSCATGNTCPTRSGYTNSYGQVVTGCTAPGPQCVPFKYSNLHGDTTPYAFTTWSIVVGDYDGTVPGPGGERDYYIANPAGAIIPGQPTPTPLSSDTPTPVPTPTPRPTPTPPGNDLSFVSGITTLGGLRNDYGNFVGTQIHIGGSNLTVTQLGRYFVNGNNQTHTVELVRVSDKAVVASSNLNMAQGVTDNLGFKYGVLSPFVTLTANTDYYLVTQEMSGGDQWEDSPPSPTVTHTNVASIPNSIWFDGNWNTQVPVDSTYGPVNFKYLPPVSTPSPTPTSTSTPTPRPTSTPTIVPTPTPIPTPTPNSCPKGSLGDIDCNGKIDIFDYNTLVGNFGKSGVGPSGGDIDGNGTVNIFDYNTLITNFGK